jgi:hypothetical protein
MLWLQGNQLNMVIYDADSVVHAYMNSAGNHLAGNSINSYQEETIPWVS